jgi:hypothetical protein
MSSPELMWIARRVHAVADEAVLRHASCSARILSLVAGQELLLRLIGGVPFDVLLHRADAPVK